MGVDTKAGPGINAALSELGVQGEQIAAAITPVYQ